jgi:hypothetical protein
VHTLLYELCNLHTCTPIGVAISCTPVGRTHADAVDDDVQTRIIHDHLYLVPIDH